ncbi:MAG: hypothetical protein AB7F89_00835 [Pirellulaceae bacterium]
MISIWWFIALLVPILLHQWLRNHLRRQRKALRQRPSQWQRFVAQTRRMQRAGQDESLSDDDV